MSPSARPVLRAGLTGGIASGKSTVSGFLRDLGAVVVDADRLAHDAILPGGPCFEAVVERFGAGILAADGTVDRAALGRIVFADAEARKELEAIVHPAVRRGIARAIEGSDAPIVIVDAALLVESGFHRDLDVLVVLRCPVETQIARLASRNGLSRSEALARIGAQAPLEAKLAVADHVIDTGGSLEATREQTAAVYRALLAELGSRAGPES